MIGLLSATLAIGAATTHVVGYGLYLRGVANTRIAPNATSWLLWVLGSSLSLAVYFQVTTDWAKLVLPVVCAVLAIGVCLQAIVMGRFVRPDRADLLVAALDLTVILVWVTSRRTSLTYVALLVDILISFVPIWRSTWRDAAGESPTPWLVWTAAYCMMLGAAALRWEGWSALALPACYIVCHAAVAVLASPTARQWNQALRRWKPAP